MKRKVNLALPEGWRKLASGAKIKCGDRLWLPQSHEWQNIHVEHVYYGAQVPRQAIVIRQRQISQERIRPTPSVLLPEGWRFLDAKEETIDGDQLWNKLAPNGGHWSKMPSHWIVHDLTIIRRIRMDAPMPYPRLCAPKPVTHMRTLKYSGDNRTEVANFTEHSWLYSPVTRTLSHPVDMSLPLVLYPGDYVVKNDAGEVRIMSSLAFDAAYQLVS